jgi:hypothetical protein
MALTASQNKQLNTAKASLLKMQSQLKTTSGGGGSSKVVPVSASSAGLTAQQAANEKAAQNIRWGVTSNDSVTYKPTAMPKVKAYTPSDISGGTTPINLPAYQAPQDIGDVVGQNNAALAPGMAQTGLTLDATTGQWTAAPTDTLAQNQATQMNTMMDMFNSKQSSESLYKDLYKETGIKKLENDVSNYTGQLNQIVNKAQADTLAVTGQGRGIPEVIIGGQQAQINKEAAIQALPIQALLATSQGNLQMAQQHLDTLFKVRSADNQAKYEFQSKILDSFTGYLNKQEERQFQAVQTAEETKIQGATRLPHHATLTSLKCRSAKRTGFSHSENQLSYLNARCHQCRRSIQR